MNICESLRAATTPYKVIVVDNGSTDASVAVISKTFPEHHIIETGKTSALFEGTMKVFGLH